MFVLCVFVLHPSCQFCSCAVSHRMLSLTDRLLSLSLAQVLRTPIQGSNLGVISPVLQLSTELLVFVFLNTLQAKFTDFAQRSDFS